MERIIDGTSETITAQMETGLVDVTVNIRRRSDNFYFDWNDLTFKTVGWTTKNAAMTEVSTSGQYEKLFNIGTVVNVSANDTYIITVQSPTSVYSPQADEIKAGDWIDKLSSNKRIKSAVYDSDGNLVSATVCTYKNSSDATNDVNPVSTVYATGTSFGGLQTGLLEIEI